MDASFPDEQNHERVKHKLGLRAQLVVAGLCLLVLSASIFRDFLFGDALLLFKDAGSDSINDYYPSFVHLSDYVRNQGFPSWSFYTGMGQDLSYLAGYLILEPVTWLPRTLIAQALIFQHLAKILLAGLLFFAFQLRGLRPAASLLGSLLLSFSAYMCMGTCWYPLADDVVCFSGLLFATEIALKRGRWFVLVPAVALLGAIDAFHLYLGALFLLLYVPARLFGQYGWQPRTVLRISLLLAGGATLGAGLSAILTLPNLYAIVNSPRGSGASSFAARLSSFPVFGFESRLHYVTAALRPFGNDILGTAEAFRGWQNYLEAPLTYCGLLCLVVIPQVFVGARRRHQLNLRIVPGEPASHHNISLAQIPLLAFSGRLLPRPFVVLDPWIDRFQRDGFFAPCRRPSSKPVASRPHNYCRHRSALFARNRNAEPNRFCIETTSDNFSGLLCRATRSRSAVEANKDHGMDHRGLSRL